MKWKKNTKWTIFFSPCSHLTQPRFVLLLLCRVISQVDKEEREAGDQRKKGRGRGKKDMDDLDSDDDCDEDDLSDFRDDSDDEEEDLDDSESKKTKNKSNVLPDISRINI